MNVFDFDMKKEHAKFESRVRAIKILIALIFLVILMGGVSIIYVGVKAAHQVEKRGLRSVVGEVWDGKGTQ